MVVRANGIIKSNTIAKSEYQNVKEMKIHLTTFLIYYNLNRGHGSLRKELHVKTPYEAIENWFEVKPEIFLEKPQIFKNKCVTLKSDLVSFHQQPCET